MTIQSDLAKVEEEIRLLLKNKAEADAVFAEINGVVDEDCDRMKKLRRTRRRYREHLRDLKKKKVELEAKQKTKKEESA